MLCIGAGPGPVEHVFPIGMRLDVERACRQQLAAVRPMSPELGKQRLPARFCRGAAAGLHRLQIGVAHEGAGRLLLCQQIVPGLGVHIGRVEGQLQGQWAGVFAAHAALQALQNAPGLYAIMDCIRALRGLRRACVSLGGVADVLLPICHATHYPHPLFCQSVLGPFDEDRMHGDGRMTRATLVASPLERLSVAHAIEAIEAEGPLDDSAILPAAHAARAERMERVLERAWMLGQRLGLPVEWQRWRHLGVWVMLGLAAAMALSAWGLAQAVIGEGRAINAMAAFVTVLGPHALMLLLWVLGLLWSYAGSGAGGTPAGIV